MVKRSTVVFAVHLWGLTSPGHGRPRNYLQSTVEVKQGRLERYHIDHLQSFDRGLVAIRVVAPIPPRARLPGDERGSYPAWTGGTTRSCPLVPTDTDTRPNLSCIDEPSPSFGADASSQWSMWGFVDGNVTDH
ncbi:hypothetical protein QBC33DRAFT_236484 [Phialemonium atrogriseum]|uniref:Uncharacterized protein n=1 Tax=Phialemonium atrogriseum TaxID=1093897 RepID=A0AAJ0C6S7_9PEZI|nr:uncharacterized protein QBC33DRAFT_236484 [Phialemonium atrogriseum]KAK1771204.1 hypothetical protein QBC33DRAFT_236484 [Phialemonium atrogriseum]